jgi:hypothetical protein
MHWEVLTQPQISLPIGRAAALLTIEDDSDRSTEVSNGLTMTVPVQKPAVQGGFDGAEALGESEAQIPRRWIDAMHATGTPEQKAAERAVHAYYRGLLRKSGVDQDTIYKVGEAIIGFLKREGPFGAMEKKEMEAFIQELLQKTSRSFSSKNQPRE